MSTNAVQSVPSTAKKPSGNIIWNMLSLLQKNLTWSIPVFMVLGVVFGYYYNPAPLKSAIVPLTFLMVYPMMVNLALKKVLSGGDTLLQVVVQVINFGIIPFVGLGIGYLFFPDNQFLILGLLLTSLLPTSGMTISWTGFAKGNMAAAVKMTVIGLILGSLAAPFYMKFLMGTTVDIPILQVFKQIAIIVFLPMVAGYATQRFIIWRYGEEKYQKEIKQKFPPISTLGVLGIVFVAMALKAKAIIANPAMLLNLLLPLVVLYGINFLLSTLVGKFAFKRGDGIAMVYGTVMRNLSIALAIAMNVFGQEGSEIALIIAMAYIIQVQAAAWYVKFTDKIFGAPALESEQRKTTPPTSANPPAPTPAPSMAPAASPALAPAAASSSSSAPSPAYNPPGRFPQVVVSQGPLTDVIQKLREPFAPHAVQWLIQTPPDAPTTLTDEDTPWAEVHPFVETQDIAEKLDCATGGDWHDTYTMSQVQASEGYAVECALTIGGITRRDVGTAHTSESDVMKQLYDEAFRRAAAKFGITLNAYRFDRVKARVQNVGRGWQLTSRARDELLTLNQCILEGTLIPAFTEVKISGCMHCAEESAAAESLSNEAETAAAVQSTGAFQAAEGTARAMGTPPKGNPQHEPVKPNLSPSQV